MNKVSHAQDELKISETIRKRDFIKSYELHAEAFPCINFRPNFLNITVLNTIKFCNLKNVSLKS